MPLHPVMDAETVAEALKAASLSDLCAELERRATKCLEMAADARRFADHEDDVMRAISLRGMADSFVAKAEIYARMTAAGRGK